MLESMYDAVLRVEQLRRDQPSQDEEGGEAFRNWSAFSFAIRYSTLITFYREISYKELVEELWDNMMVKVPLETRYVRTLRLSHS